MRMIMQEDGYSSFEALARKYPGIRSRKWTSDTLTALHRAGWLPAIAAPETGRLLFCETALSDLLKTRPAQIKL